MSNGDDKIKILYDAVSKDYDLGTEQEFRTKLSNPEKRKAFFDGVGAEYDLGNFKDFESKIGFAGMDSPRPSVPKYQKALEKDRDSWKSVLGSAYNNIVGSAERLLGGLIEMAPTPAYIPEELGKYQKIEAKEAVGKALGKVKTKAVTEEQKQAIEAGFDITDGFGMKDIKALVAMSGSVLGDIALAAPTGGATYFIQGYGDGVKEYDEATKRTGIKGNDVTRALFGTVNGTINGLLETYALNKVFGEGPALKSIKKKVVSEVFDEAVKSGKTITTDVLEKMAESRVRKLASTVRAKGAKVLYSSYVEGATEGIQSGLQDAAKLVTNKVENREVFDSEDIKKNLATNILNSTVAGAALGLPMGGLSALTTHVDKQVLKDVASAKTQADFDAIRKDLNETFEKNNFSEEEKDAVIKKMEEYAKIKQSIPQVLPSGVQEKAISKINERNQIDTDISSKESQIANLDESIKNDTQSEIDLLKDKRSLINDEIRESVSDDKFTYYEEDGKYFKRLGETTPEEISKNYFDLASVKESQVKDKPAPTDKNLIPTILVDGREYNGANHGEAMMKAIEAGEDVPNPDTEFGKEWRQENGLFRDINGKIFTREESKDEYGVSSSQELIKEEIPSEQKYYSKTYLRKLDAKEYLRTIDKMDPPSDAREVAMRALATGSKVNPKSFAKETGLGRETFGNKFIDKNAPNVERLAENLWFDLPEEIQMKMEPQDIRNELITYLSEYRSPIDVGRDYIERYTPKEFEDRMIDEDYMELGENAGIKKAEWERWMNEEVSAEEVGISDEKVIEDLINKYEQESTTKGERVAPTAEGEVVEGVVSDDAYESARKTATEDELTDYESFRRDELRDEESFRRDYEQNARIEDGESREEYIRRKYCKVRQESI